MKLVAVRHAQAGGNKDRTIMSWRDVGLTELGREQARELAGRLDGRSFDAIYSSPLRRSVDTVKPYANKCHQNVLVDERLKEVNFGEFIGWPQDSTVAFFGKDIYGLYGSYEYDLRQFGGESSGQVEARVNSFIEDLKKSGALTVLVVSHDGILHWVYYILTGKKIDSIPNVDAHEFSI